MPPFTVQLPDGKLMDVDAADENAAIEGAKSWYASNVTSKTDTSITGALSQGASDLVSGIGKTVKTYVSPDTGKTIEAAGQRVANPKYKSATEGFSNPEDGAENHVLRRDWSKLPRAFVEQAPQMAGPLLATLAMKRFGPLVSALGGAAAFGLQTAGNEAQKAATARTGDESAEPETADKMRGAASTAAQSLLNQYGISKIVNPGRVAATGAAGVLQSGANVAKAAAAEGLTNAGQDAVSQAVTKSGTDAKFDPNSTLDSGIFGTVGGTVFSGVRGAKDAASAVRFRDTDFGNDTALAANRINSKVSDPSELEKPSTAYEAVRTSMADARNELSSASDNIKNASPEASNALKRAKAGEALTADDLKAIDAEGSKAVSSLARQITALKKLTDKGSYDPKTERFAGGVGERVRKFALNNPLFAVGGAALPHIATNGFSGVDQLAASIPGVVESAIAGVGAYTALKSIEKKMGVRSPARTFTEKFSNGDDVRVADQRNSITSVPSVAPKENPLRTPGPWGEIPEKPQKFQPDILEPGLQKIVDKIQRDKRNDVAKDLSWTLRKFSREQQMAEDSEPKLDVAGTNEQIKGALRMYAARQKLAETPKMDVSALNEQVRGALLMHSARQKIAGQRQAEAEAADSVLINDNGGLEELRNPAFGKRAKELIGAADAMRRLRHVPEEESGDAPTAPNDPVPPVSDAPAGNSGSGAEALPESPYWHLEPVEASARILSDALAGGKEVRNPAGFRAGTQRRLQGEQDAYMEISNTMPKEDQQAFHKYLSALWGSDSPSIVEQVRDRMKAEFPQHSAAIDKHLSDEKIKTLWTKPKKKKN